ncbi:MAG: hypothetical protein GH143_08265 [Calditrichaeota bacterium]|nr:hypothetical protein [Calditrichota bacterium]
MKDRLPRMSIRIDTTPEEFLRRIKALALQIGEFIVESERDPAGGDQVATLRLKPILVTQHRELAGHIIVIPASPDRVTVEVHASHWQPDPPTYRAYAAAAREIFKPLLHQYNRKFHLNRDDVHRLLVSAGFTIEHAANLADIFEHGRALHKRGWKDQAGGD